VFCSTFVLLPKGDFCPASHGLFLTLTCKKWLNFNQVQYNRCAINMLLPVGFLQQRWPSVLLFEAVGLLLNYRQQELRGLFWLSIFGTRMRAGMQLEELKIKRTG